MISRTGCVGSGLWRSLITTSRPPSQRVICATKDRTWDRTFDLAFPYDRDSVAHIAKKLLSGIARENVGTQGKKP